MWPSTSALKSDFFILCDLAGMLITVGWLTCIHNCMISLWKAGRLSICSFYHSLS